MNRNFEHFTDWKHTHTHTDSQLVSSWIWNLTSHPSWLAGFCLSTQSGLVFLVTLIPQMIILTIDIFFLEETIRFKKVNRNPLKPIASSIVSSKFWLKIVMKYKMETIPIGSMGPVCLPTFGSCIWYREICHTWMLWDSYKMDEITMKDQFSGSQFLDVWISTQKYFLAQFYDLTQKTGELHSLKLNIAPENRHFQKEMIVLKPSILQVRLLLGSGIMTPTTQHILTDVFPS